MSLSKLAAKCRVCPFVDTCDHKEMEAYGFLPLPAQEQTIIFSGAGEDDLVRAGKETGTDALIKEAARVFQIPEQMLKR